VFGKTNCSVLKNIRIYTSEDIQRYLKGQLSPEEMHALEMAALEDSLLSDAIEGVEISLQKQGSEKLEQDLSQLRRRLLDRTGHRKKSFPLLSSWNRVGVAACFLILIGAGVITYYYLLVRPASHPAIAIENEKITKPASPSAGSADSTFGMTETAKTETHLADSARPGKSVTRNSRQIPHSISLHNNSLSRYKEDTLKQDDLATISVPNTPSPASKTKAVDFLEKEKKNKNESEAVAGRPESGSLPAAEQLTNKSYFKGKVIDPDNRPIIAASVFLNGLDTRTLTDVNGAFFIYLPKTADSMVNITINSYGYRPASLAIKNNNAAGNIIRLQPADSFQSRMALNENAVLIAEKKGLNYLVPAIGWAEYQHYLDRNKKITSSDSVIRGIEIISFGLSRKKTPDSFKVEKSLSPSHDAEVIRLIKEGPPWKLLKSKKARARVAVSF
jgi:hypothetical protein